QQPAYTPIRPFRNRTGDDPAVTLVPLPPAAAERARTADGARGVEAAMIVDLLSRVVAQKEWMILDRDGRRRPAVYGDFALLFRGLTGLDAFEEALRARDIPYRVIGGRAFYRRQEAEHLHRILNAVDNQRDGVSVGAARRWFCCRPRESSGRRSSSRPSIWRAGTRRWATRASDRSCVSYRPWRRKSATSPNLPRSRNGMTSSA